MKFIGQYIQQLIARFRNDVYLEDISTGTIASGGNLGLDSNNKIVKNTVSGGGSVTVSDSNTDDAFPVVFHDESNNLHDDTGTFFYNPNEQTLNVGTSTSAVIGTSGTAQALTFRAQDDTDTSTGPIFDFRKSRGGSTAGQNNDISGQIKFINKNDASPAEVTTFAEILSTIANVTDGDERGKIELKVANDGTLRNGITMTGTDTAEEVDVTIGNGAASLTTLAGTLTMGSTATLNNSGVLQVAAQPNITTLAGVFTGSANQLLTDDGDGTVTSESGLTYDSSSDTLQLTSTSASYPRLEIKSNANTTSGQRLVFIKDRGVAPSDGDTLGILRFEGEDSNQNATFYAQMFASIATAANGSEGGKITFQVASHDGEAVSALEIIDGNAEDEVDVNIASGTSSLTTIAGNLQVNGSVTGDLVVNGNLKVISEIKILPSDFIADDVGRPLMINDTTSNRFLESHSTAKMYASINIPTGLKATQLIIYGSGTSAITVYEANIDSRSVTSKGTGNIGTLLNFTDITGSTSNYLLIELDQASSEEVYGGKVTIA
jgi:hypothetical protein